MFYFYKKINMKKINICLLVIVTMFAFSCKNTTSTDSEISKSSVNADVDKTNKSNIKLEATSSSKSVKVTTSTKAGEMSWHGMADVEQLVKDDPKKIIVDVYTQWCGPCKMMDRNTFSDSEVQKAINEKFHAVKFDAEGAQDIVFKGRTYSNPNYMPNKRGRNAPHELSKFFAVRGYPTLVVLDENFNILHKLVGYKQPAQLLEAIAEI